MKFNLKQKLISTSLASVLACLLTVSVVLAYSYSAPLQESEANGNAYDELGAQFAIDNDFLASNGYILSSGLDTRVTSGGTAIPHMVVDDSTMFTEDLAAYGTNNLQYQLGESALSNFDIIPGYGGYITIADAAALELGDDFEIEFNDVYVDTDSGTDKYLIYKEECFELEVTDDEEITARTGYIIPTGHNDPSSAWTDETKAYDGVQAGLGAYDNVGATSWSEYLELTYTTPISISSLRFDSSSCDAQVDIYYDAGWHNVFDDEASGNWDYVYFETQTIDTARIRLYNDNGYGVALYCNEFHFGGIELVATGIATGEHDIAIAYDGTDFNLTIDTVEEDTADITGYTFTDNSNNWILMDNSTTDFMPYMNYYKHTVSSTLIAHYQPNAIISGTTLPDREGTAQNGTFTFGSNPAGVTCTLDSFVSASQPTPSGILISQDSEDVMPEVTQPGWFDVDGLTTNPFYPLIGELADASGFSEYQLWLLMATTIVLIATAISYGFLRNQLLSGVVMLAATGLFVAMGIYPFWVILISVFLLVTLIVFERKPVV